MNDDLQTIHRIRDGDIQAYELLVRAYQGRIRGYCLGVLGHGAEADDAAQEIFIKAYRGLAGFKGGAAFSTWLHRIAINHCRDLLRKKRRSSAESWEALYERQGDRVDPGTPGLSQSQKRDIWEALNRLSEEYKTVLILREVEGLSYQEITEVLNCSVDAVKARLKRARQALTTQTKVL